MDKTALEYVDAALGQASEQFGNEWGINDLRYEALTNACAILDDFINEFECDAFVVEVDVRKTLWLTVECPEIILQTGRSHPFFQMITAFDGFSFSSKQEDSLKITFHMDNLWYKLYG